MFLAVQGCPMEGMGGLYPSWCVKDICQHPDKSFEMAAIAAVERDGLLSRPLTGHMKVHSPVLAWSDVGKGGLSPFGFRRSRQLPRLVLLL